ncbi:MAG: hypothetical protein AB8E82_13230 [Aureispira sp.]
MQEVLDEQQARQEEQKTPAVVYRLTGSYAGLWGVIVIGEFEMFRGLMTGLATIAFLLLSFVISIAVLVELRHKMSSRLRYYGYWMLGLQLWLVISVVQVFLGYTLINSVVLFDLLAIAVLGSIGLFLARYYKNRTEAAAWWAWLEQSIGWYLFLHLETFAAFLDFSPWYNATPIIVAQIILLWLGAGLLLGRQYRHYTKLERQVSLLLYSSFGLVVSIVEIEATNSVFLELLLVLAILLLVRAIAHARTERINSKQYE